MDVQGAAVARPWLRQAGVRFPATVDGSGVLAARFGLKVVPVALFVDADRRLLEPPAPLDIRKPETRHAVEGWLGGERDRPGLAVDRDGGEGGAEQLRAAALLRLAALQVQDDERQAALDSLRQARALDPDNWLIRKQVWALQDPERFYDGDVDLDWQREQIAHGR